MASLYITLHCMYNVPGVWYKMYRNLIQEHTRLIPHPHLHPYKHLLQLSAQQG